MVAEGVSTNQSTKLSHKRWKSLLKKEKRRTHRQEEARARETNLPTHLTEEQYDVAANSDNNEPGSREDDVEQQRQHHLWWQRELAAQKEWQLKQERLETEKQRRLEQEQKIREEWKEREKKEKEELEEKAKLDETKREKQDALLKQATANEKSSSWHNPIISAPVGRERENCPFFTKTAACRFGDRCSRSHLHPEISSTLLFPGMFVNFRLEQSLDEEHETDIALEYDDTELYQNFTDFYDDVLSEFKKVGKVVQFKVCCNCEQHLRGNVYVQYRNETEAEKALIKFNGRWYGGRQISGQFVNIAKWKSAICALHFRKKCPKGNHCNFLHVFRNPDNEFWDADRDFMNSQHNSFNRQFHNHNGNRRSSRNQEYHRRRSRSRSPYSSRQRRRRSSSRDRRSSSRDRRSVSKYSRSHSRRSRSPRSRSQYCSRSPSRSRRSRSNSPHRSKESSGDSSRKLKNGNHTSRSRSKSQSRSNSHQPSAELELSEERNRSRSRSEEKLESSHSSDESYADVSAHRDKKKRKKHKHKHRKHKHKEKLEENENIEASNLISNDNAE